MKMGIDFYYMALSSPCRAVHMVAEEYGIPLNIKHINLKNGEHLKPSFLKVNPMHIIPTIDDDGFYLWESAAIITYFANKFGGPDDKLYPKDPQKRALVDKVLHFYSGSLYSTYFAFYAPQIFFKNKPDPELQKKLFNALNGVESFLFDRDYLAGGNRTLADLAILATIVSIENFDVDMSQWPKIEEWLKRMKSELSYYDKVNKQGLVDYKNWFLGL